MPAVTIKSTRLLNWRPLSLAVQRLHDDQRLHEPFRRLHKCGPRAVAMFVAELLDRIDADPGELNLVLTWLGDCDPDVVAAIAGDFPRPPLNCVMAAA